MVDDRRRRRSAPFRPRNYRAAAPTMTTYFTPREALDRYVRGSGEYPWRPRLRTPIGPIELLVPVHEYPDGVRRLRS